MIRPGRFASWCAAAALAATCAVAWSCGAFAPNEQSCTGCSPPDFCRVTCQIDAEGNGECECFASCDPPPPACADDAGCDCLVKHATPPLDPPPYTCTGDAAAGFMLESKSCTP